MGFLDLANAFGSVPHSLLWKAFSYFITSNYTTSLQHLETGIMARCAISPLAFTMAMEVMIRASKWVVGGERLQGGTRLPPIPADMDDMTMLTTTAPCTRWLLAKLND